MSHQLKLAVSGSILLADSLGYSSLMSPQPQPIFDEIFHGAEAIGTESHEMDT